MTWLPAGEVFVGIDPSSAQGKVVIPSVQYRGNPIKNLKMTFFKGRLTKLTADQNADKSQKSLKKWGKEDWQTKEEYDKNKAKKAVTAAKRAKQ